MKYTKTTQDLSVFKLLMEKKPYQMEGENLVRSAIIYKNLEMLEIALNEPYNFNVHLVSHFEFAIKLKNVNDSILTILINKLDKNIVSSNIKTGDSKLWRISNEKKYKEYLIQFIISNQNEFCKPLSLLPNNNKEIQPKSIKFNGLFDSLYQILFIKSNELQNKILDLDYFSNSYNMLYFKYCCIRLCQLSKSTIQLVLLHFRIYFKCKNQSDIPLEIQSSINEIMVGNNNNDIQKKSLLKLLISISGSKQLIRYYHLHYSELINGHLEIKTLKSGNILLNNFNNIINGSDSEKINQIIKIINKFTIDNQDQTKKLYRFKQFINSIRNYILSTLNTKEKYESTINKNLIYSNESFVIFGLPLVWDPILVEITNPLTIKTGKLIIETKESIDWISEFTSDENKITPSIKSIYFKKRSKGLVEFKTYELFIHSNKISGNRYYCKPIPLYPIKWSAISNNPIKPLIYKLNLCDTIINEQFQSTQTNISKLIKEITFGGSGGDDDDCSYQFKPTLIIHFIRQIEFTKGLNEIEINSILLNPTVEINLINSNSIDELIQLLFNSIVEFDLNVCKFIYNQINFQQHLDQFNKIWQNSISNPKDRRLSRMLFTFDGGIFIDKYLAVEKSVKFINFWIEIINSTTSSCNDTTTSTFKLILNYIYDKILSIAGISMNQILSILDLINKSSTTKQLMDTQTIYHSFFYLNIKSPKLVKYIIMTTDGYSNIELNTIKNQYIIDLLNPNILSLDYIINESFDSILNYLVQFKYKHVVVEEKKIRSYHQTNLNYYLKIKRIDLFFKEMEILKLKFNKKTNPFTFNYELLLISRISEISEFNQDLSLIDKFLTIEESISNEPYSYKNIIGYSKRGANNEILSFLINRYNLESIPINNTINNVFIEYLCKSHPNIVLNSIKEIKMFSTSFIETIDTLLKYFPNNYKITETNIKTAIGNSDFTILKYYKNKGLINY